MIVEAYAIGSRCSVITKFSKTKKKKKNATKYRRRQFSGGLTSAANSRLCPSSLSLSSKVGFQRRRGDIIQKSISKNANLSRKTWVPLWWLCHKKKMALIT